jgi:hypothetical protein
MDIPSVIKRTLEKSTPATDFTHLINKEMLCLAVNNIDHITGGVRNNFDALRIRDDVLFCIIRLLSIIREKVKLHDSLEVGSASVISCKKGKDQIQSVLVAQRSNLAPSNDSN